MSSSGVGYANPKAAAYAGARAGVVDPFGCGYNITPANTARLRAAIGRVAAGTGMGEIGFFGDSSTVGSTLPNGTYQVTQAWAFYMRTLNTILPAAAQSDGLVRVIGGSTSQDPRWVAVGSWANNSAWANSSAINDTATFTTTNNGTSISVEYFDYGDNSAFTIQPGGGAGLTAVTNAGPVGWKRKDITGLATPTNTFQVKHTVGANIGIAAGGIWLPNTLLFHNMAQNNSTASQTGADSWTDFAFANGSAGNVFVTPHLVGVARTDPDAVIIELGANDVKNTVNATNAQVTAALRTIIANMPNSDIILAASQQLVTTALTAARWESYVSSLYDLADSLALPLLDFRNLSGNYTQSVAAGYTVDGFGHFLPFANATLGRAAARALL